jgi:hydroxyacylglutathione hydrolase
MWESLAKLRRLPAATRIYCGHEYTLSNSKFCLAMEPGNAALAERTAEVEALRANGQPTLPTRLDRELETNVFLRPDSPEIRARLDLKNAEDWEVFAALRERKNKA